MDKNGKFKKSLLFYYCPDKCVSLSLLLKVEVECLFVLLYITRPRDITSTIMAIAIDTRHVYNVINEGAKNKIVVQKKMCFVCVCFKVLTVS